MEAISFLNHKDSVHLPIYCKFCPNNFPHSNAWVMIYTHFVELHCLMFHAKLQNHRPSILKVFAIYSHGGHLGHVTRTVYTNFRSPFLRMLHMKFGFDWPSGFRGEDL